VFRHASTPSASLAAWTSWARFCSRR
jgi:hypothetical protein